MIVRALSIVIGCLVFVVSPAVAQFGKNKVQYEEFTWHYIQSKHFDVYYHQGGKYLADYTAVISEQFLNKLQRELNYQITQRIALIIYNSHNDFQQTNTINAMLSEGIGGVTELFKNRVVLPFEGKWQQFHHVIRHELVHAVLNDMFYGGSVQSLIANNIRTELPLWMNEGFAEYASLEGLNTQTDMFIRDLAINENLPPLDRLNGYLAYRGGQTFYWYVAEKYGKAKVGELINRLKSVGTVDGAMESTFGMDLEEFSKQWRKDMKKIYWPDIVAYDDPEDFASRITDHEKDNAFYNTSPALSPNGEKMAFISDRDRFFSVYILNLDNKKQVRRIVEGSRSRDFEELNILTPGLSWDPEGRRIAISAKSGGEDALFIVDVEEEDTEKLSFGFRTMSSVDWAPDGKHIAFVASTHEQPDLYLYNTESGDLRNITNDIFTDLEPTWSPDSKTLYFISDRDEFIDKRMTASNYKMWKHDQTNSDIYSLSIETGEIQRITFDPQHQKTSIVVGPDNDKLLFVSDRSGISNVYSLDLKSGEVNPKTNSLTGITQLSLSRDGSKMLFASQYNGGYDIFLLRFPFDLPTKEPKLTEFRKKTIEHSKLLTDAAPVATDTLAAFTEPAEVDTLAGYGNFDIDFSRQKAVQANPDAVALYDEEELVEEELLIDDEFTPNRYKINFTPDLIYGNAGFDTFFGVQGTTQMMFSDMLGNHQIYFAANLLLSITNSDFYLQYSYLPNLIDYQFNAFHTARFVRQEDDFLYRFRYFGAGASAELPFNTFERLEFGFTWLNTVTENVDEPELESTSKMHIVPKVRYVHDDVMWGYFGPRRGSRYFLKAEGSPKFSDDHLGFVTVTGDYRHYVDVGAGFTLAMRGSGGASFGPDPQSFFVGGTQNWINRTFSDDVLPYQSAEDLYFLQPGYPLRGFDINELNGTKYFITNVEFRLPVLLNVFFDMGGAWTDDFVATARDENGTRISNDLLMSTGLGLRLFLLGFPLKIDVAWKNNFHAFSKPRWLISLGPDF